MGPCTSRGFWAEKGLIPPSRVMAFAVRLEAPARRSPAFARDPFKPAIAYPGPAVCRPCEKSLTSGAALRAAVCDALPKRPRPLTKRFELSIAFSAEAGVKIACFSSSSLKKYNASGDRAEAVFETRSFAFVTFPFFVLIFCDSVTPSTLTFRSSAPRLLPFTELEELTDDRKTLEGIVHQLKRAVRPSISYSSPRGRLSNRDFEPSSL